MIYVVILMILIVMELVYLRIANYYNIIDKPKLRSSHNSFVLRGGGIIFPMVMFLFFLINRFAYPWFTLGLFLLAAISFADDIRNQSVFLRIMLHFIAAICLLYQLSDMGLLVYAIGWYMFTILGIVGLVNAYNFMDGINGITTAYSFTILGALYYLNDKLVIFNMDAIFYIALANIVFFFFNFREKAKCFAGDVGSVCMGYILLFFVACVILKTGSLIFILLFAVYGTDATLTIIDRLKKKENIFVASRQHLYHYLANEMQWPHLRVSAIYSLLQAIISIIVCLIYKESIVIQLVFVACVLIIFSMVHVFVKRYIFKVRDIPV